jgi:hypothetical protein
MSLAPVFLPAAGNGFSTKWLVPGRIFVLKLCLTNGCEFQNNGLKLENIKEIFSHLVPLVARSSLS